MRRLFYRFLRDERGQAMVERALIACFFTLAILASTKYVVDGIVSYYSYVSGMICLPIP
ncbi:MAG: Flp family type IVb pilin [Planctomycetota bacterium]|jgi:Flp pilus assembly pilin Flp